MDAIDTEIVKGFMNSYTNNIQFSNLVANTFNRFYLQNVKYHLLWLFIHSFAYIYDPSTTTTSGGLTVTDVQKKLQVANFIYYTIPKFLTDFCSSCSSDYYLYIVQQDIMTAVEDSGKLSKFFLNLHNHISRTNFDNNIKDPRPPFIIDVNSQKLYANTPPTPPTLYTTTDLGNKYGSGNALFYIDRLNTKFGVSMIDLLNNAELPNFYEKFNEINLTTDINANFKVDIKVSF
jgi:hypothetical protein